MFIMATRKRPKECLEKCQVFQHLGVVSKILLVIDVDDDSYNGIEFPGNVIIERVPPSYGDITHCDYITAKYPNEEFYGYIADDFYPKTPQFDNKIKQYLKIKPVLNLQDNYRAPFMNEFVFVSNEFMRIVGLNPIKTSHFYSDTIQYLLAAGNNLCLFTPDIIIEHQQFKLIGKGADDTTKKLRNQEIMQICQKLFHNFVNSKEFDNLCFKLRAKYNTYVPHGIPLFREDLFQKYHIGFLGNEIYTTQEYDYKTHPHYQKFIQDVGQIKPEMFFRKPI